MENYKYIVLEDEIPYDWDDYNVWGVIFYNITKDEIETSKFGHGTDWLGRKESIEYDDATQEIKDAIRMCLCRKFANVSVLLKWGVSGFGYNIPVRIIGGRKAKGCSGILTAVDCSVNTFMKRRYPWKDCRKYRPFVVLDSGEGVSPASINYLEIIDAEMVNADLADKMFKCEKITVKRMAHIYAYDMSYSACDTRYANAEREDIVKIAMTNKQN